MSEFLRTRLVERHTTATEVIEEKLPTDPISHLIITLDGYNVTDETTLAEILAFINNIQVTDHGAAVYDLQSEDLYGIQAYLHRKLPELTGRLATDNYVRSLTLIAQFGRKLYNPDECYPARKSGDVILRLDTTVPATSLDNSTVEVDVVTLPGATPSHWLKTYRKAISAPGATGEHEIDLNRGNQLLAVQIRMGNVPTTSEHTYDIDQIALLCNNKEHMLAAADMMCLAGERALRIGPCDATIAAQGLSSLNNIFWLDFDPDGDGRFAIDTGEYSRVHLKATYGESVAENLTFLERVAA